MRTRIVMIIMAVALIALPTMAQDWQSTSAMQSTGSSYSSQVTAVGATGVTSMATTTESYSPSKGPHRVKKDEVDIGGFDGTGDPDTGQSSQSPLGDALIPLMLCACAYLIVRATRRRTLNR